MKSYFSYVCFHYVLFATPLERHPLVVSIIFRLKKVGCSTRPGTGRNGEPLVHCRYWIIPASAVAECQARATPSTARWSSVNVIWLVLYCNVKLITTSYLRVVTSALKKIWTCNVQLPHPNFRVNIIFTTMAHFLSLESDFYVELSKQSMWN